MKRIFVAAMMASLLAACTSTEEPTATDSTTTSPAETTPAETTRDDTTSEEPSKTVDEESTPADTIDEADLATGPTQSEDFPDLLGQFLPLEARVGGHGNYDRVVVEYDDGEGQLGWSASYEDEAIQDGSGFPIDMEGQRFLTIAVTGARYPDQDEAKDEIAVTGLDQATVVKDVEVDYPFEGMHMIFVGVDADHPYRVQVFHDPERIVIDILHD